MRRFVPAFVGCCVLLWEALLQFGTVQTTLSALRSSGPTGAFMAKFLSSQVVILSLAVAAIVLAVKGAWTARKLKSSDEGETKTPRVVVVNQNMKNSAKSIQAGRDVKK
jgi:putative Ca2+/H+ antiporter (TMEM165/GDT1 family)